MLRNHLVIFLLFLSYSAIAQFAPTIRSIPPNGRLMGAFTVGKGVFQVQSGLNHSNLKNNSQGVLSEQWSHNTALRYGIFENFEVNAVIGWRRRNIIIDPSIPDDSGIHNTQIGARYNILDGSNGLVMSVQGRILLRAQSEVFRRAKTGSTLQVGLGHRIAKWLVLNMSAGGAWPGNESFTFVTALRPRFIISDRFGVVIEGDQVFNSGNSNFDLGIGMYYLVVDNFKLDLYSVPFEEGGRSVQLGFSWRMHNRGGN